MLSFPSCRYSHRQRSYGQIRDDIIHSYFPGIEPNCSDSCGVKVSSLNKWFEAIKLNNVIVGPDDTVRAFFLCGTYFFPDRKRQRSYWLVGCFGGFGDCGIIRLGFGNSSSHILLSPSLVKMSRRLYELFLATHIGKCKKLILYVLNQKFMV